MDGNQVVVDQSGDVVHGEDEVLDGEKKLAMMGLMVGIGLPTMMLLIMLGLCCFRCSVGGGGNKEVKKRYADLVQDQSQKMEGDNYDTKPAVVSMINDQKKRSGGSKDVFKPTLKTTKKCPPEKCQSRRS